MAEQRLGATAGVLLGPYGEVHRDDERGHTLCGKPVRAGSAVAVSASQVMVYGLTLCTNCYPTRLK